MSNIYFDIETIPAGDRLSPEEIRAPSNYKNPEVILKYQQEHVEEEYRGRAVIPHKLEIISIALAFDDKTNDASFVFINNKEENILQLFGDILYNHAKEKIWAYNWVCFNGREFDIPALRMKASKYKLFDLWAVIPKKRYDERIKDLMDEFYLPSKKMVSFKDACDFYSIKCKSEIDGSQVYDLYQKGEFDKLAKYGREEVFALRELHIAINCGRET